MIRRVKGTQDLLDMSHFDAIVQKASEHFRGANFAHIETPLMEHHNLFLHSVGEHTDIVNKEMYTFSPNGKETLCLRPEGTAGTMRAFLENNVEQKPWQVFSCGPMFRHERPQKGRFRQFHQFNAEAIGISSIVDDVRFLSTLDDLFSRGMGLRDYVLSINFLGTPDDRTAHKNVLKSFLEKQKTDLCPTCKERMTTNILRVFDCKNEECQKRYQDAPVITDHLSDESQKNWNQLNELLDMLSTNRIHNPFLVRGLDYYHNTVFEFSSPLLGAQNAFCGGGQYDLTKQLGYKNPVAAIGCAIGMERLELLLEAAGNPLKIPSKKPLHAIIPAYSAQEPLALLAYQTLHRAGICCDIISGGIKKGMKKANKAGASYVLIIGEEEQARESVLVKNMQSGNQDLVSHESLVSYFS